MGTLCNACGINYRRALKMYPDLDLDKLSQQVAATTVTPNEKPRASIQKSIKRQRKKGVNTALPTAKKKKKQQIQSNRNSNNSNNDKSNWLSVILCLDHRDHHKHGPLEPVSSTTETEMDMNMNMSVEMNMNMNIEAAATATSNIASATAPFRPTIQNLLC